MARGWVDQGGIAVARNLANPSSILNRMNPRRAPYQVLHVSCCGAGLYDLGRTTHVPAS